MNGELKRKYPDIILHLPDSRDIIIDSKVSLSAWQEYCNSEEGEQPSLKEIKIYTDSIYLKEGITVWIEKWEKNNWKTSDKKNVKNIDLWKKLKELTKPIRVEWCWIKGHSGDPMNDLADKLAKEATPI